MIILEIAGHLGADPETRVIPSGNKVTVLRVATNIRQGDKDETIWWEASFWGTEYENMIKHLKKGSAVIVIGEMQKLQIYTDKAGNPQIGYRMTGRMLKFSPFGKSDGKSERANNNESANPEPQTANANSYGSQANFSSQNHDDDLPPF
ncbi:MAG: single-stranded DNA-binding protein [Parachlamydiaceae bacterium]|nr:single-stranded DNA-binding protein [Parachlamydiaceae bacterium]